MSAELQVRQPPSHPASAASSFSQEPAPTGDLQRPPWRRPPTQPSSAASTGPSARHASPGASAAPGDLHQLPPESAALPGGPLPLGIQQLPELPEHSTQHALAARPPAELPTQRQPEQPLSAPRFHHRTAGAASPQFQPPASQTPTKDIQKGASAAAASMPLIGGEQRQQPVSRRRVSDHWTQATDQTRSRLRPPCIDLSHPRCASQGISSSAFTLNPLCQWETLTSVPADKQQAAEALPHSLPYQGGLNVRGGSALSCRAWFSSGIDANRSPAAARGFCRSPALQPN